MFRGLYKGWVLAIWRRPKTPFSVDTPLLLP